GGRNYLAGQPKPLRAEHIYQQGDAGNITTRPVITCDQAQFDGVLATGENDRDGCRGRLRCERSRGTTSTNHCDLSAHEFARERRQSIHSTFCPAVFNADIVVLDIAGLNEALPERGNGIFECSGRSSVEEPDHRHRRLLRARRERPHRRTAEQRDEPAALHVWMAPAWQEIIWRAAQRSLAVMCPACSRSPEGLLALMESANRGLITRAGSMSR